MDGGLWIVLAAVAVVLAAFMTANALRRAPQAAVAYFRWTREVEKRCRRVGCHAQAERPSRYCSWECEKAWMHLSGDERPVHHPLNQKAEIVTGIGGLAVLVCVIYALDRLVG